MTVLDLVAAARQLGGLRLGPGLSVSRGKGHVKVTEQEMDLLKALQGQGAIPVSNVMNRSAGAIWRCTYQRDKRGTVRKALQRLNRKLRQADRAVLRGGREVPHAGVRAGGPAGRELHRLLPGRAGGGGGRGRAGPSAGRGGAGRGERVRGGEFRGDAAG